METALTPGHAGRGRIGTYLRSLPAVLVMGFLALASVSSGTIDHLILGQVVTVTAGEARDLGAMLLGPTGQSQPVDRGGAAAMVHSHLDGLAATDVTFYASDGTVVYGYRTERIGSVAPASTFAGLSGDRPLVTRSDWDPFSGRLATERVLVAVPNPAGGAPLGYVGLTRDVSPVLAELGLIDAATAALLLLLGVGIYLLLRGLYVSSTAELERTSRELRRAYSEVSVTYEATLRALSSALDRRDSDTEGHSMRVTAYTLALGSALGLPRGDLLLLARAALLHDIGKIGVPDRVLRKPGPLDASEWEEMRRHPEIGVEMLAGIPFLRETLPVVHFHHERWDGGGYPAGLDGEHIPLHARIFAVADAYDAMTADRPYRRALPQEQAVAELRRGRGSQFDPSIVDAFLSYPLQHWEAMAALAGTSGGGTQVISRLLDDPSTAHPQGA